MNRAPNASSESFLARRLNSKASSATGNLTRRWLFSIAGALGGLAVLSPGCSSPNQVNIELRKENQKLTGQVADLKRQNDGLEAQLKALQSGATTQQLPETRLDQLFTVHGLSIGKLTGGYTENPDKPGDQMLKVYAVPTDDDGEPVKAAGSFSIELFDLAEKGDTHLGKWDFPTSQARGDWFGRALLYTYVLPCPWQKIPNRGKLLAPVTFTDELTNRRFTVDQQVNITPPG